MIFGRNERVAWGITNNICSQRDLYQEKTDPDHPDQFLYDGTWEQSRVTVERIAIKNGEPVDLQVRFSRNGPIVDEILPPLGRGTGPVSLRWVGATFCDEVTSLLAANLATTCDEFREAMRGWRAPTLSWVFADADDHIGYQCVGCIPIRENWNRGYRRGWDPEDQWRDLIPFDGMPALSDPPDGWIRTANNRTAPDDYPYPLSGTWATGYRARRIRNVLEEKTVLSRDDCSELQMDTYSLRAEEVIPHLLELLGSVEDSEVRGASIFSVPGIAAWIRARSAPPFSRSSSQNGNKPSLVSASRVTQSHQWPEPWRVSLSSSWRRTAVDGLPAPTGARLPPRP